MSVEATQVTSCTSVASSEMKEEKKEKNEAIEEDETLEETNGNDEISQDDLEIQDEACSDNGDVVGETSADVKEDALIDQQSGTKWKSENSIEKVENEVNEVTSDKANAEDNESGRAFLSSVKMCRLPRPVFDMLAHIDEDGSVRFNMTQFRMWMNIELWHMCKYVEGKEWKTVDHPMLDLTVPKNAAPDILVRSFLPENMAWEEHRIQLENKMIDNIPAGFHKMTANQRNRTIAKMRKTAVTQAQKLFKKKGNGGQAAPNPAAKSQSAPKPVAGSPAKAVAQSVAEIVPEKPSVPSVILPAQILPAEPMPGSSKKTDYAAKNNQNAKKRPHESVDKGAQKSSSNINGKPGPNASPAKGKSAQPQPQKTFPKKGVPAKTQNNKQLQQQRGNQNGKQQERTPQSGKQRGGPNQQPNRNSGAGNQRRDSQMGPDAKKMRWRDQQNGGGRDREARNSWSENPNTGRQMQGMSHPAFNNRPTVNWSNTTASAAAVSPWAAPPAAIRQQHSDNSDLESLMRRAAYEQNTIQPVPAPVPRHQVDIGADGLSGMLLGQLSAALGSSHQPTGTGRTTFDQYQRSASPVRMSNNYGGSSMGSYGYTEKRSAADLDMDRYVEPLDKQQLPRGAGLYGVGVGMGMSGDHGSAMGMGSNSNINSSFDNRLMGQQSSMGAFSSPMGGMNTSYGSSNGMSGGLGFSGNPGNGLMMSQSEPRDSYGSFLNQLNSNQRDNGRERNGSPRRSHGGGGRNRGRRDRR